MMPPDQNPHQTFSGYNEDSWFFAQLWTTFFPVQRKMCFISVDYLFHFPFAPEPNQRMYDELGGLGALYCVSGISYRCMTKSIRKIRQVELTEKPNSSLTTNNREVWVFRHTFSNRSNIPAWPLVSASYRHCSISNFAIIRWIDRSSRKVWRISRIFVKRQSKKLSKFGHSYWKTIYLFLAYPCRIQKGFINCFGILKGVICKIHIATSSRRHKWFRAKY